jgi:hypothetical protein
MSLSCSIALNYLSPVLDDMTLIAAQIETAEMHVVVLVATIATLVELG